LRIIVFMKRFIIYILALFFGISGVFCLGSSASVFDGILWIKDKGFRDLDLYYYFDGKDSYYKAEKFLTGFSKERIVESLTNLENYSKIFPRTDIFEKKMDLGDSTYLVYTKIDFFPMKNRDYFIELKVEDSPDLTIISWIPSFERNAKDNIKDLIRVERAYGRWIVKKLGGDKIFISVEYSNDWKLENIPSSFINSSMKNGTADALRNLLKYVDALMRKR